MALLAAALCAQAASMFRPRYIVGLSVWAAAWVVSTDFAADQVTGELDLAGGAWTAAILVMVGAFLATLGQHIAATRAALVLAREEAEKQARAAHAAQGRLDAFARNSPATMLIFDKGGVPVFVDAGTARATGRAMSELGAGEAWEPFLGDDLRPLRHALGEALRGNTSNVEFHTRDKEGVVGTYTGIFFGLPDGAGAICLDVTQERALQARMARMDRIETLGTLVGGMAHDFNNLLTAVLGNLYLIDLHLDEADATREFTASAREAAEAGAAIVRQMMVYSGPDEGAAEPVPMMEVVSTALRLAKTALRDVDIVLNPCDHPVVVQARPGTLEQVFVNLLMNAADAMAGSGSLTISCELANGDEPPTWAIHLDDTGPGIEPAVIARIFDPYFTTKPRGKGTGLGLATADSIVRAAGGWIDVTPRVPRGTRFTVHLPAAEAAATGSARGEGLEPKGGTASAPLLRYPGPRHVPAAHGEAGDDLQADAVRDLGRDSPAVIGR